MTDPQEIAAWQKQQARRIALGVREISLQKTALLRAVIRAQLEKDQPMTVTDEDREAAAALRGALEFGQVHFDEAVMFYRRDIERKAAQAERDAVVKWLMKKDAYGWSGQMAQAIEAREHLGG